jgi:hypothetical protein
MVGFLAGGQRTLAEALAATPPLALFVRWLSLHLVPLLVVFSASEAVSADVAPRTLRYEALRTGRAEIVAGRMLGQWFVVVTVLAVAFVGVAAVGLVSMTGVSAWDLGMSLSAAAASSSAASLPFLGLAIGVSQLGTSPAWSRALGLVAWATLAAAYGLLRWLGDDASWCDAVLPLFPHDWTPLYWGFGTMPWVAAAVHGAQGVCFAALGFGPFSGRDL